jgi:hypothetical protein
VNETAKHETGVVTFLLTFKISFIRVDAAVNEKRNRNFWLRFREYNSFLKYFYVGSVRLSNINLLLCLIHDYCSSTVKYLTCFRDVFHKSTGHRFGFPSISLSFSHSAL